MMKGRVVVTGGAGFIGSHLAERLLDSGYKVTVIDNLSNGSASNLRRSAKNGNFRFYRASINSPRLAGLIGGSESVVHLAAITSVIRSKAKPLETDHTNVVGTLNLLEACRRAGVGKFVFASSAAVYGNQERLPINETAIARPSSLYGASKLAGEAYCQAFFESFGLRSTIFRFFNVYGTRRAGGEYAGALTKFASAISNDVPPTIFGDGLQTRDFVSVKDIVSGIEASLESTPKGAEVINLASGKQTTVQRLVGMVATAMGRKSPHPTYKPGRDGEVRYSYADIARAKTVLKFEPKVSLEDGIKEYCDWFVEESNH